MSARDPQQGSAGHAPRPVEPDCVCGDMATVHLLGTRRGLATRTRCSRSSCDCRQYRAVT